MLAKGGDNEAGELYGWLFLNYCPFGYLCQGSLLASRIVSTLSAVSRKTMWLWLPFTKSHSQISKPLKPLKISWMFIYRQLNIIRNSVGFEDWTRSDAWIMWGLKPLSKQNGNGFAEYRSGYRRSCPESLTYRPNQVVPHKGRSTHESAPPLKGHPLLLLCRRSDGQKQSVFCSDTPWTGT